MKIIINGCAGRMGRTLMRLVQAHEACQLAGGLEPADAPDIGKDIGPMIGMRELGLVVNCAPETVLKNADAVIDFSTPQSSTAISTLAAQYGIAHIIGTTGFTAKQEAAISEAAGRAAIVKSGNMSLGVNLLTTLVRRTAAALGEDWDIEIFEMHHRHKIDAPSGTALMLGMAAAKGRGRAHEELRQDKRVGARERGAIGYASLRGGSTVGEHEVIFGGAEEQVRMGHRAESRDIFARGAIAAALWARKQPPGLYGMEDVLGFGKK